jgi:hypothetical protein
MQVGLGQPAYMKTRPFYKGAHLPNHKLNANERIEMQEEGIYTYLVQAGGFLSTVSPEIHFFHKGVF